MFYQSHEKMNTEFHYLPSSNLLLRAHCLQMRASWVLPGHITTADFIFSLWFSLLKTPSQLFLKDKIYLKCTKQTPTFKILK